MTYLVGSSSLTGFTVNTNYNNNSTFVTVNGNDTQGLAASTSGTLGKLNLYIASWTAPTTSLKACLYENNTLIGTVIVPSSAGTGLVSVTFPGSLTIIAGSQRYRLGIYLNTSGGLNLWTKTGALTRRDLSSGSYTSPVTTLPACNFSSTNEFYWSLETAPTYSIDSIDGDDSVEVGQTFSINTTGFTGQPTGATNNANVAVTVTGGSANVWTATVTNRQNNVILGLLPITPIQLTLTNGGETANRNFTLTKQSDDILVTFTGANTADPTYITTALAGLGYTVEGAGFWYKVPVGMSDLLVLPTGVVDVTNTGTFTAWFRPTSGLGSGKYYYFDVTVTEGGVVIVTLTHNNYYIGFGISI
jgi:hypothetical protein